MAIVSSVQGGLILAAIIVFLVVGRYVWILPAIALIVALHFFPMPAILGRTIDYCLGAVMLIVADVGLYLASQPSISWQLTWGVTGIGGAHVTSAYGLYIVLEGRRVVRSYRALATN